MQAAVSAGRLDFDHVLFAPLHYEPGYAYPLIVWLHGRGSDERQLPRIMPLVSMRNYVAVAPRGIRATDAGGAAADACLWLQTDDHIQQAEQRVFDCIEAAAKSTTSRGNGCSWSASIAAARWPCVWP